jgi:hypothetical protein
VVREEHKQYGILVEDLKESEHLLDASSNFRILLKRILKM